MFVVRKFILALLGLGFAFVVSSCHDAAKAKKCDVAIAKACKDKPEKHRQRW